MRNSLSVRAGVVRNGTVRVRVRDYRSPDFRRDLLPFLWVHGGGFAAGSLRMPEADAVACAIAVRTRRWVRTTDYRRVPLWPLLGLGRPRPTANQFPAARDDVDAVLEDMLQAASGCIAGGASAGACLVQSVLVHRRDAGLPNADGAALAYGTFHPELPPHTEDLAELAGSTRYRFTPESTRLMNLNYAGSEDALTAPQTFPGGQDPRGLPPTFMIDAERDALRASSETYAGELSSAGVPLHRVVVSGAAHGFLGEPRSAHFARAIDEIVAWLDHMP